MLPILLLAEACILPAPNLETYRGKGVDAAESGSSATATAVLTGTTLARGDLAGPMAVVILEDAGQSAATARDAFASIQPPDSASDRLRDELLPILSRAAAEIGEMTIVARRGDTSRLLSMTRDVEQTTAELQRFASRYG
jgi:hypothetical protein